MVFAAGEPDSSGATAADAVTSDGSGTGTAAGTATGGTDTERIPATRSTAATGAAPVNTAFPIGYVGVRWAGAAGREARIRFTGKDGTRGEWRAVGTGCAQVNGGGTALVPAGSASGYEVEAPKGSTEVRSLAIDTTGGAKVAYKVPSAPIRMRGLKYLPRAAWGCDESKRYKNGQVSSPGVYYPAQVLTVHHTDTRNDDPHPAATVRAIYEYHAVTNSWGDIGYHFLIDEAGGIYEGRYSGDDGIPAHDKDGNVVTAFHTAGFNSGNLGIALLGTFVDRGPTDAAKESLIKLIAALSRFHGLDPRAMITYKNPISGVTRDVTTVGGHRDWMKTDCPGGTMYAELDSVRAAAAASRGGPR
jgi:hypothetical protein